MYPTFSSRATIRNSSVICGKKTSTPPTPAIAPIRDEVPERPRQERVHLVGEPREAAGHGRHRRRGYHEDGLEEEHHHDGEDDHAPNGGEQHGIHVSGTCLGLRCSDGDGHDRVDPFRARRAGFRWGHDRPCPLVRGLEQLSQFVDAGAAMADHTDDRDADGQRQALDIDRTATRHDLVHHREHQARRPVDLHHLGDQQQRAFERRRIRHDHQCVGSVDPRNEPVQRVHHHLLIRTDRRQRVRAGEIHKGHGSARQLYLSLTASDRHARIVGRLGPQPGQSIEQGGLARVGTTHQRNVTGRQRCAAGSTVGCAVVSHRCLLGRDRVHHHQSSPVAPQREPGAPSS